MMGANYDRRHKKSNLRGSKTMARLRISYRFYAGPGDRLFYYGAFRVVVLRKVWSWLTIFRDAQYAIQAHELKSLRSKQ